MPTSLPKGGLPLPGSTLLPSKYSNLTTSALTSPSPIPICNMPLNSRTEIQSLTFNILVVLFALASLLVGYLQFTQSKRKDRGSLEGNEV
jgi:hypothetical protein